MGDETSIDSFPLLSYLDGLIDEMRNAIPVALSEWEPEAVHKVRVTSRRMKAALSLMEPVLRKKTRKSFDKTMRKLRRRFGPLRDVDVMIKESPHMGSAMGDQFERTNAWLSKQLHEEREEVRRQTAKGKSADHLVDKLCDWSVVREEIAAAREAVNSLLSESLHAQLEAFTEQAGQLAVDGDAHGLRVAGKNLRYTLELAAVAGHSLPESVMEAFKEMQDLLGSWHDRVVLTEFAMKHALRTHVAHRDVALAKDILNELGEIMNLTGATLWEFGEVWKKEGATIAGAIRAAFPLARPVTESQTDPDPSGSASPADSEATPPAAPSDA